MTVIIPDFEWYSKISQEKALPPRCPFATVDHCPRYYQSISLLKYTGATAIDSSVGDSLFERWKRSPLWPLIGEQETSVSGSSDRPASILSNFCPEVSYERHGLFASHLAEYADTLDLEMAQENLGRRGVPGSDWRWHWASVRPMHFSECPLYSVLLHTQHASEILSDAEELLEIKPGAFGVSLNVKELVTRFCLWWLRRVRRIREQDDD